MGMGMGMGMEMGMEPHRPGVEHRAATRRQVQVLSHRLLGQARVHLHSKSSCLVKAPTRTGWGLGLDLQIRA